VKAQAAYCVGNSRQLMLAWIQYYGDNNDQLVNNFGGLFAANEEKNKTYNNWVNDVMTWAVNDPLGNRVDNLDGITQAPFFKYAGNINIYRCAADHYVSAAQSGAGISARPRSYSMNMFFGANRPGDTGTVNNTFSDYTQFLKASTIVNPSQLFVTCDEHPDSINDGFLQTDPHPTSTAWNDLPATYHDGACGFAFADGHAVIHKFRSTTCTILPVLYQTFQGARAVPFAQGGIDAANDAQFVENAASIPAQ
jgi:prepilin-type processing-associated H-X9-DG protein